jgi:Flp pilus assembly protein TadG
MTARTSFPRRNSARESGSATVFIIGFALVLLTMAGVVVDGGLALNARQRVTDDVEQAARAGSLNLDLDLLRNRGTVAINPERAIPAAQDFLTRRGYTSADKITVTANAQKITVTAVVEQKTAMLSLLHIDHFTIKAAGEARPTVGINSGNIP